MPESKPSADVTKIKSLRDGIEFFNEFLAGTIVTVTGEVLRMPRIDTNNPS